MNFNKYPIRLVPVENVSVFKKDFELLQAKKIEEQISQMVSEGYEFHSFEEIQGVKYIIFKEIKD